MREAFRRKTPRGKKPHPPATATEIQICQTSSLRLDSVTQRAVSLKMFHLPVAAVVIGAFC
jgi:hypothetical protein